MLSRVPYDRGADRVAGLLAQLVRRLPEQLLRSITWDQGVEMADHARFTVATGVPVYFCILILRGSVGATRTPTACSVNTSRKAPTCPSTPRPNSTPLPADLVTGPARHWTGISPSNASTICHYLRAF